MATKWPEPGLANVGSYQVAGHPYISGSTTMPAGQQMKFEFPYVTKTVTVVNHATQTLRVHFNASASGRVVDGVHFVELDSDEDSYTFNAKCKEIYVSAPSTNSGASNFRVVAELTGIPTTSMYSLTGSGLTD
tara:strand:+ start:1225 stop:1623 length:399 start_codon:yes stop_codon:yes gene_type:complete